MVLATQVVRLTGEVPVAKLQLKISCFLLVRPALQGRKAACRPGRGPPLTVLRRLFRRLMVAWSSGFNHGLVYLPNLDSPTCVLAVKIKVLLSPRTRSRREMSSGEKAAMDVSTASAKPCQFTSFVFHRARRWLSEGFDTWQLMAVRSMVDRVTAGAQKRG